MELVILACLLATPGDCYEERLQVSMEPITAMRCLAGAQPIMAQWAAYHPKYRIERWRCRAPDRSRDA